MKIKIFDKTLCIYYTSHAHKTKQTFLFSDIWHKLWNSDAWYGGSALQSTARMLGLKQSIFTVVALLSYLKWPAWECCVGGGENCSAQMLESAQIVTNQYSWMYLFIPILITHLKEEQKIYLVICNAMGNFCCSIPAGKPLLRISLLFCARCNIYSFNPSMCIYSIFSRH